MGAGPRRGSQGTTDRIALRQRYCSRSLTQFPCNSGVWINEVIYTHLNPLTKGLTVLLVSWIVNTSGNKSVKIWLGGELSKREAVCSGRLACGRKLLGKGLSTRLMSCMSERQPERGSTRKVLSALRVSLSPVGLLGFPALPLTNCMLLVPECPHL